MKTIFESIRLEINTIKKRVPVGTTLMGNFRLAKDFCSARFDEEPLPFVGFTPKNLRLRHGHGYQVCFNPERNRYRITLNFDPSNPDWFDFVSKNFERCMKYVEGREK